jgi:hypothetical protein
LPLEWRFSKDKNRVGGVDFLKVDALEFSAVPVPALPTALVTARSAGIDTGPLYEWAEKVLDDRGQVLIPRAELETLRRAAKPGGDRSTETAMATRRARAAELKNRIAAELAIEERRTRAVQLREKYTADETPAVIARRANARRMAADLLR